MDMDGSWTWARRKNNKVFEKSRLFVQTLLVPKPKGGATELNVHAEVKSHDRSHELPKTPNNMTPGRAEIEAPAPLIMTPGRAEFEAPGQVIMTSRFAHNAWLSFLGVSIRFLSSPYGWPH